MVSSGMSESLLDRSQATPDEVRRRALLVASLGFALLDVRGRQEIATVKRWLGTWAAVGLITAGMHRHGYDLSLTQYDDRGWRATFYTTGMVHSITSSTGSAFEATPWLAAQRAAWAALRRHP
jgi:hypothetical protein